MATADVSDDAPAPRLCHLIKWPDFDGYGFNLHAEKSKTGQYIGKVDKDSPAELAGLRQGDRIIEVNDVNIANENHKQVVERIKLLPNETKMLVLDEESDRYYKERKIVVKSTMKNVVHQITPVPRPGPISSPATNGPTTNVTNASSPSSSSEAGSISGSTEAESPAPARLKKHDEVPSHLEPRLCHLVKWPDFDGYGFNIHADKTRNGHIIGKVDPDSPAETAGLRQGDRIIEVNTVSVLAITHKEVVEIIKSVPNETRLLVLSEEAEKYYEDKNITVKGGDKNVVYIKTPFPRPQSAQKSSSQNDIQLSSAPKAQQPSSPVKINSPVVQPSEETSKQEPMPKPSPQPSSRPESLHEPSPSPKTSDRSEHSENGLNLNISVAEMRQIIAQRKKVDPKTKQMDLKKKFQMVQNM